MKKYITLTLVIGLSFNACNNPFEKEIREVEGLLTIVKNTEDSLFSVDTSKVFAAKRQMERDLVIFNSVIDTMSKEEAFKMADIFGNKKKLYRLTSNYPDFVNQIEFSKNQLNNFKTDLENGLISKEEFQNHYNSEQASVMELNSQISKSIAGLEVVLQKLELDRPGLLEILEKRRMKAVNVE